MDKIEHLFFPFRALDEGQSVVIIANYIERMTQISRSRRIFVSGALNRKKASQRGKFDETACFWQLFCDF